jgi:hypothetical protein
VLLGACVSVDNWMPHSVMAQAVVAHGGVPACAGAAAPELGIAELTVHHALHRHELHTHEHRERGERGVGTRVPSLCVSQFSAGTARTNEISIFLAFMNHDM